MTRGYSLEQDLKLLINNPKYSDVEILCKDEKKLYGCRAILAARSEVFDRLLYNGMRESFEKQISFPTIHSSEMEILLRYIYTGSIEFDSLTNDNVIEAFYAADYFQLLELQNFIFKKIKNVTSYKNSPELLSKVLEVMPLVEDVEDNRLLSFLVEEAATISLNTIEFDRFSITGLQFLLSCTHEKERAFVTPEYEVFRYSAILAANQVSNDAYETLKKQLPTLEQLEDEQLKGPIHQVLENKLIITDRQEVIKELEPLIEFIDFRRIESKILDDIIKPLEIIPTEVFLSVHQYRTLSKNLDLLRDIRGLPHYAWNNSACGSNLFFEHYNGKVVRSYNHSYQSISAKAILDKGIFEWDIFIERSCRLYSVGMCALENFDYKHFKGAQSQPNGWVLDSDGYCWNSNKKSYYCPPFYSSKCTKITIHLDMSKRCCYFIVKGIKYPEVPSWNNLPSKLHPVVSIKYPGRFRIQAHQ